MTRHLSPPPRLLLASSSPPRLLTLLHPLCPRDYISEPNAVGGQAASQSASVWKELQRGAQRSLEVQFSAKVLKPVASYLGEIEGIKKLHDQRQKRLMDYDYYKRKVSLALTLNLNPNPLLCPYPD